MHNWEQVSNPLDHWGLLMQEREREGGDEGRRKKGVWSKKKKMKIAQRDIDDFQNFDLSLWATKRITGGSERYGMGQVAQGSQEDPSQVRGWI